MNKNNYYPANDEFGNDPSVPIMTQPPPSYPMQQPPMYPSGAPTIVIQQPMQQQMFGGRQWSSGVCSMCDDMESCCCSLFFPTCYLSCLYGKYGECCCTSCCVPHPAFALRVQHRNRHKIAGTMLNDCCTSTFCLLCVICQIKRDMDYVIASKGSLAM